MRTIILGLEHEQALLAGSIAKKVFGHSTTILVAHSPAEIARRLAQVSEKADVIVYTKVLGAGRDLATKELEKILDEDELVSDPHMLQKSSERRDEAWKGTLEARTLSERLSELRQISSVGRIVILSMRFDPYPEGDLCLPEDTEVFYMKPGGLESWHQLFARFRELWN